MDYSEKKYFIQAPPGAGKTYAAEKRPDVLADVDWGVFARINIKDENGNVRGCRARKRNVCRIYKNFRKAHIQWAV